MNYEDDRRRYHSQIFSQHPRADKGPHDWPDEANIDIDKLAKTQISWAIRNWVWLFGFVAIGLIYITIRVSLFWYQAEVFRKDVSQQLRELNTTVTTLTTRIAAIMDSPAIIRTRDLRDFCLLAERENPNTFQCPGAYLTDTQKANTWRAQEK